MSKNLPGIDAHCHLFNLWYLFSELLTIGRDAIVYGYPRSAGTLKGATPAGDANGNAGLKREILDCIRRVSQITRSMFNDYEENYLMLRKSYLRAHPRESSLVAVPLMMDIYYMFADAPSARALDSAKPLRGDLGGTQEPRAEEFATWFDEATGIIRAAEAIRASSEFPTYASVLSPPSLQRLDEEIEALRSYLSGLGPAKAPGKRDADTTDMTPGFRKEIADSIALQKRYPDEIFPFLAVDPRRPGIMSLVKDGGMFNVAGPLVSHDGPFYGIKLYSRLGYDPESLENLGLLAWCADSDIPMTVHCNSSGFPFEAWRWKNNSDPALWAPYLERYAKEGRPLRIDFAHFASNDGRWRSTILDFINHPQTYGDRVYSDLSCYTDTGDLEKAKAAYDANEGMAERLMFGTDFDVMLLTDKIDLGRYFDRFQSVFGVDDEKDYEDALARRAPRAFLNAPRLSEAAKTGIAHSASFAETRALEAERKKLGREIRLGWLRDYPDARDYSVFTSRPGKRQKRGDAAKSVWQMIEPAFVAAGKTLPPAVDLRRWCPPVEDQKTIGSCTANAAVGLVEYFERRATGKHIDASRLFLYKVTRKLLGWTGDTGAYLRTTMESLVLFGAPPESYFPYEPAAFDNEPEPFAYAFAQNYKTASYFRLDPAGTTSTELLQAAKTALAAGYPAAFGFSVYDSLYEAERNGGFVPYPSRVDAALGGHAVMAVGYDDSLEIQGSTEGSVPTKGAILFRNSWGPNWGDRGYGWLPYDYVLAGLAVDWWSIVKQEWVDTGAFGPA